PVLPWQDAIADGRSLVRAFRLPETDQAVLVTQDAGVLATSTLDLDALRAVSADPAGHSPFDGWERLDSVFQVAAPEPRAVFSRGTDLVIFTWSTRSWTTATLGVLPDGAPGLAAAFFGINGKLYYFASNKYAEVDPSHLDSNQVFVPVDTRWGRPSLFSWLLSSVDGALFGP